MKRSEMLEIIAKVIHYSDNLDGNWDMKHSTKAAEEVLHEIEMNGMLPSFDCGYLHKWEPEE